MKKINWIYLCIFFICIFFTACSKPQEIIVESETNTIAEILINQEETEEIKDIKVNKENETKENIKKTIDEIERAILNFKITNSDGELIPFKLYMDNKEYKSNNGDLSIKDIAYTTKTETKKSIKIESDNYKTLNKEIIINGDEMFYTETLEDQISEINIKVVSNNIINKDFNNLYIKNNESNIFASLKPILENTDILTLNINPMFVSDENQIGISSKIGHLIADVGFNNILYATTNAYDSKLSGISNTLNFWNSSYPEINIHGINLNKKNRENLNILNIKDTKISLLNYTIDLGLKEDQTFLVNRLNEKEIEKDLSNAKKESEFIIVCVYYDETSDKDYWKNYFAMNGVDLLIVTSPNNIEDPQILTVLNKNKQEEKMLYFGGLGNYLNNPYDFNGAIANINIKKERDNVNILNFNNIYTKLDISENDYLLFEILE